MTSVPIYDAQGKKLGTAMLDEPATDWQAIRQARQSELSAVPGWKAIKDAYVPPLSANGT